MGINADSQKSPSAYFGSCLCGKIKYQVDDIEPKMGHCHCIMCRKFHGSAFSSFGEAKKQNFRWVSGESQLKTYMADNGTKRLFCENCGSSLVFIPSGIDNGRVEFALGTLDSDIPQSPDAHIFTAYKANWFNVTDGLPTYKEGR